MRSPLGSAFWQTAAGLASVAQTGFDPTAMRAGDAAHIGIVWNYAPVGDHPKPSEDTHLTHMRWEYME